MKIIFGQKNDLLQNVSFYLLFYFFLVGRGGINISGHCNIPVHRDVTCSCCLGNLFWDTCAACQFSPLMTYQCLLFS